MVDIEKAKVIVKALKCSCEVRPAGSTCEGCEYRGLDKVTDEFLANAGVIINGENYWEYCDIERMEIDAAEMIENIIGGDLDVR